MKSHYVACVLSLLAAATSTRTAAADPAPPAVGAAPAPTPPGPSGAAPPSSSPPGSVPIEPESNRPPPPRPRIRPPPPPPPPEERPPPARVEFVPNDPSVTLLTMNGVTPIAYPGYYHYGWGWGFRRRFFYGGYAPVFSPICRGPCTASMEPGTYELALEKDGRVVRAPPTYIPGNAELHGTYVDRSGTRTAGVIILVVGSITGVVMTVASFERHETCDIDVCFDQDTVNGPLFAGGLGVLIGSIVTGSILASLHDRAEITVTPLRVSSWRAAPALALDRSVTEGASLSLRF